MTYKSLGLFSSIAAAAIITLSGCTSTLETDLKQQATNRIARPAFMVERSVDAGSFKIRAWERMHAPHSSATIYIGGDSFQEIRAPKKTNPIINWLEPSPNNPVALHLASRDKSKNLAHLAMPCQYIKNASKKGCASAYWTTDRFKPEVMTAYEAALDDIAARYDITGFNLVGYDGGANIAAVMAARRPDVLSLRTVAGNLNPDLAAENNLHAPLASNSVMAVAYGSALANVPQHHFIGAADAKITPAIYHSYRQMVGISDCIHYSLVPDADHEHGWLEKWPELLKLQPQCAAVKKELPPLPPAEDFPGNYHKGTTMGYSK